MVKNMAVLFGTQNQRFLMSTNFRVVSQCALGPWRRRRMIPRMCHNLG
jgi:hypothetical protein